MKDKRPSRRKSYKSRLNMNRYVSKTKKYKKKRLS